MHPDTKAHMHRMLEHPDDGVFPAATSEQMGSGPTALTPEEAKAIKEFKALAKRWPKTLWLYSASGSLHVMKKGPAGEQVHLPNCGIDPAYVVDTINIQNDGGDW